jgi:hypothetical protein
LAALVAASPETNPSPPGSADPLDLGSSTNVADTEAIPDLCKALWLYKYTSCLGYLNNEQDSYNCLQLFYNTTVTIPAEGSKSTTSLKDLLQLPLKKFSRSEKAVLALTLTKAILQLHTMKWMDENWTKKDVLFRTQDSGVVFEDVYFAREFLSFISTPSQHLPLSNGGVPTAAKKEQDSSPAQVAANIARLCNSFECRWSQD